MIPNKINEIEQVKKIRGKTYHFLRWTERWTKTDMIYLTKGGFWLTVGQVISSLSALILSIAFANLIPKEVYGNYKYILSIASILTITTMGEINTALTRAIARGYRGTLIYPMKVKIKWGILGGLSSMGVAIYYFTNGNIHLTISFLICAVFLPIMDPLAIYNSFLNGRKLFKVYTRYNIISKIVSTFITITILFFTKNLLLIIFSYFALNTIIRALILYIISRKYEFSQEKDKEIISYGKHLTTMGIISALAGQLDKIITYHYLGAVELAIYSFAIAMPEQIKSVFKNINTLAFPKFSEQQEKEPDNNFLKKIAKYIFITVFIFIAYVISAPFIYKIIFPQYTASIIYSQIFALSLLAFPSGLLIMKLQSKKEKNKLYKFNLSISLIQIVLLFLFLKLWGLMGIILARVTIRFIALFLGIYLYIQKD